MPRLLIVHASVASGHRRAALALAAAFTRKPGGEVRVEDALAYGGKVFRRAYAQTYLDLIEHAPALWRLFYEGTNITDPEWIALANRLRSLVEGMDVTHLERLVHRFAPSAIVCTHFLPVDLLLRLKRRGRLPQPIYCVVTDFAAHAFWAIPGIDGYFVASDLTREQLIARGVAPTIIRVCGIPVDPAIAEPKPLALMRARHGFPTDVPLISLFGGGLDVARVRRMVEGQSLRPGFQGTFQVQGGITTRTIGAAARSGAEFLVAGTELCYHPHGCASHVVAKAMLEEAADVLVASGSVSRGGMRPTREEVAMALRRFTRWLYRGRRPNVLARALNDVSAALHALGIAPNYLVTLQVIGRRSGRAIAFPLVMVVVDGQRYLVSMLGTDVAWVRNLRAAEGQALLRHGQIERVRLEEVAMEQRSRVLKAYLQRAPGARAHVPVDKDAPLEQFEAIAPQLPVFRVLAAGE
jgi:hypothetical protein